ncbi:BT3A3 protein, partial [Atractosteus spatula]|nr:BT3A3 protein [Atractosteus spatula]
CMTVGVRLFCCLLSPESFTVQVPDKPLVAQLGADLMLPCHLSPARSAEPLEVRWGRKERNEEVHLYRHRTERQGRAFEGRVRLFKDSLKQGNVSLLIRDLRVSDEGLYTCFVESGSYYGRGEVEVKISMTGSAPLVSLEGHEGGGIRLSCHSEGWYPAPEVLWADETGAPVPKTRGIFTRSREGLYSVSTHLLLSGQGQAEVSCVLEFGGDGRQIQSRIHVSGAFFTPAQPWFISAVVLVVIFLISLIYVIILKKGRETASINNNNNNNNNNNKLCSLADGRWGDMERILLLSRQTLDKHCFCLCSCTGAEEELDSIKVSNNTTSLSADQHHVCWIEIHYLSFLLKDDIIMDKETSHPKLRVSEDGKRVQYDESLKDVPNNEIRYKYWSGVLGIQGFSSGKHYWEVNVGELDHWDLGVAYETVRRDLIGDIQPNHGYMSIWFVYNEYRALDTTRPRIQTKGTVHTVGVFLDYEGGKVSFYDVENKLHLYTFSKNFEGKLYPFFNPWGNSKPLTIT